jgi:SAM-dependent methyltransferase
MRTREERARTFDEVAELYDRHRPGYPERLVDDVLELASAPAEPSVLEIGCATGKATLPFARRGCRMLCLEPGPRLAAIARRALTEFPNVRIEEWTFEEARAPEGAFDLVMAAQSFHLLDPRLRFHLAARALHAGGSLAIFGNRPTGRATDQHPVLREAYERHAPELLRTDSEPSIEEEIRASGRFEAPVTRRYAWSAVYTAADYRGLMETQSQHRLLPPSRRDLFFPAIERAIESSGGTIEVEYVTTLHLARLAARERG